MARTAACNLVSAGTDNNQAFNPANNLASSRKVTDNSLDTAGTGSNRQAATVVMASQGPRIPMESEQATSEFFVC